MADSRLLKLKNDGTPDNSASVTTSTGVPELLRDTIVNEIPRYFAHANDPSALLRFSLTSKFYTAMTKNILFRLSAMNAEPARNDSSADVTIEGVKQLKGSRSTFYHL